MTCVVNQHWDQLTTCVVGRTYPNELLSFISDRNARYVLERISNETEQDLQNFIGLLERFDVEVLRPAAVDNIQVGDKILPPPITPRDDIAVIGNKVFMPTTNKNARWNDIRGEDWPELPPADDHEWQLLDSWIKQELKDIYGITKLEDLYYKDFSNYKNIEKHFLQHGNKIYYDRKIDSAMVSRIGKDLFFGTWEENEDRLSEYQDLFPDYTCHIIDTQGHLDGVFCPVAPGLIVSNTEISLEQFKSNFPGWEVVYISPTERSKEFVKLKASTQGKWWVPGEENNSDFTNFVNYMLGDWTGFCEETTIGVNLFMLDRKNIVCSVEDDKVFRKFAEYGIETHVVPFRHSNFWDSGWHCLTNDINRKGKSKDHFQGNAHE